MKTAEQWADDIFGKLTGATLECERLDRDDQVKSLRQIQADALRSAASVAYDGCQGDKIIHDLLIHEANQLDPEGGKLK